MEPLTHEDLKVAYIDVHETMDQLRTVLLTESEIRDELNPLVSGYRATAEQARLWWSAHDPLNETRSIITAVGLSKYGAEADCSLIHSNDDYYANLTADMTKAGVAILSEVLTGRTPLELSQEMQMRRDTEDGERIDVIQITELLGALLSVRAGFTIDELEMIDVAQELIASSIKQLQDYLKLDHYSVGHMTPEEVEAHFENLYILSSTAHQVVQAGSEMLETDYPDAEIEEVDRIRLMGLRAAVKLNAAVESTSPNAGLPELYSRAERAEELKDLIDCARKLFDNPKSTMWQRLKSGHIKGPLHEILWYMDTTILKLVYPERYRTAAVWPANHNADRPVIGRPTWNRAYDYAIHVDDDVHYFQLKSSPQKDKKHHQDKKHGRQCHPAVTLLEEENFREVQPARLRAKLRAYQRVLSGELSQEEKEEVLDKYVMPTAFFAMESSTKGVASRQLQIKRLLEKHYLPGLSNGAAGPRLNRQQRRALDKKKRRSAR